MKLRSLLMGLSCVLSVNFAGTGLEKVWTKNLQTLEIEAEQKSLVTEFVHQALNQKKLHKDEIKAQWKELYALIQNSDASETLVDAKMQHIQEIEKTMVKDWLKANLELRNMLGNENYVLLITEQEAAPSPETN